VPQYGGEITIRAGRNIVNFDPYFTEGLTNIYGAWLERLVTDDWTTDPMSGIIKSPGTLQIPKRQPGRKLGIPGPDNPRYSSPKGDSMAKSAAGQRP